jgi:hypothetical protein
MTYYLFGICLSILGAYFGYRGAEWVRTRSKTIIGDSPRHQLLINAAMVGLAMMILVLTLSTLTA